MTGRREIRFIGGFGLFHGWLIALLTYPGTEPLGGPGIFAPIALVLAGGMVSAVAFIAVPQRHLKALSAATDALLVAAACLVLAAFLAPSPAVILACCGVCGLLCGALHCLYGLASLAFPKHDFARIIALATAAWPRPSPSPPCSSASIWPRSGRPSYWWRCPSRRRSS